MPKFMFFAVKPVTPSEESNARRRVGAWIVVLQFTASAGLIVAWLTHLAGFTSDLQKILSAVLAVVAGGSGFLIGRTRKQ
jgi:hypothetical protein